MRIHSRLTVMILAIVLVGSFGCDQTPDDGEEPSNSEEYHSPFVVEGEGELRFDTITFTDVGLKAREGGPAESYLLETIAESLAYELESRAAFEFSAQVQHDESLRDPSNHLFCDRQHLYVALWRGYEPERWGYSLWSGCHDQQKFQWEEIEDGYLGEADVLTRVEPLTESIVDSVEEAHQQDCFSMNC